MAGEPDSGPRVLAAIVLGVATFFCVLAALPALILLGMALPGVASPGFSLAQRLVCVLSVLACLSLLVTPMVGWGLFMLRRHLWATAVGAWPLVLSLCIAVYVGEALEGFGPG